MAIKKTTKKTDWKKTGPKSISLIKRYWLIIGLMILAVGLSLLRISQRGSNDTLVIPPAPKEKIEQPLLGNFSPPPYVQIKINEFPFPKELPIFWGKKNEISRQKAETIATALGFSQPAE